MLDKQVVTSINEDNLLFKKCYKNDWIDVICLPIAALFISPAVMPFEIVTRAEWGAKPPKDIVRYNKTVPYVIIHHSYLPPACLTSEQCIKGMLGMQRFHQIDRGWFDIGYQCVHISFWFDLLYKKDLFHNYIFRFVIHSFAVGGDGKVYEGRGFNVVGAHAPGYNDKSIGICLIGDWQSISYILERFPYYNFVSSKILQKLPHQEKCYKWLKISFPMLLKMAT